MSKMHPATGEAVVPLDREILRDLLSNQRFDVRRASIRETNNLVNSIEQVTGLKFIRMEFGIPGRAAGSPIAIEAEHRRPASNDSWAMSTRRSTGVLELKQEAARFARKAFMDVEVSRRACCVPDRSARWRAVSPASLLASQAAHPARKHGALPRAGFPGEQAADANSWD